MNRSPYVQFPVSDQDSAAETIPYDVSSWRLKLINCPVHNKSSLMIALPERSPGKFQPPSCTVYVGALSLELSPQLLGQYIIAIWNQRAHGLCTA